MNVFITGATGLVGRALALRLRRDGHSVTAWSRSIEKARALLGPEVAIVTGQDEALTDALAASDAVVTLAGEPVLPARWTAQRKARLRQSRVDLNADIVQRILSRDARPQVILAASAVGFYGDTGQNTVDETAPAGKGFLADLCTDWENAFRPAADAGIRVVWGRIGIVLATDGGALAPMLPLARTGVLGPMGSGKQGLPWIHLHDLVEAMVLLLTHPDAHGPVNLVGPESASQASFARDLAKAVGMPAWLPAPGFAMKLALGEAASALLEGQYVAPKRLSALGFSYTWPTLPGALQHLLQPTGADITRVYGPVTVDCGADALAATAPTHTLRATQVVRASPEAVWSFFDRAGNLGAVTPGDAGFGADPSVDRMRTGDRFCHTLAIGPVRLDWAGEVVAHVDGKRFVDVQRRGPFGCFWHEHTVEPVVLEDGTTASRISDHIHFSAPLGALGAAVGGPIAAAQLRQLFHYRQLSLHLRFGALDS